MEKFCRTHYANHSDKTCQEFVNLFKEMVLPHELQEEDEEEEEEQEYVEPSSNMHLIWDDTKLYDIDYDIMEESCVGNDYSFLE